MRSSSKRDLIIAAFVVFVGSAVAIAFDTVERFHEFTRTYEHWEVDEIIVIFVILSFGASWFAWRRWRDANQFNQLIRDALDAAEDGFLIYGPDDRLYFRNARHKDLYPDFAPFMTVGRTFTEIIEAGRENGVTLFEPLDEYLEARLKLRDAPGETYKLRTSSGDRQIDNRDVVTKDGYFVSTRTNVTDRAKFENELSESEERFRNLVEGSVQGIIIHRDAKPVFVNESWARMHGYTVEEVLNLDSVFETFAPHERERLSELRDARLRGDEVPIFVEYQGLRKDGKTIWISNIARVVTWEGQQAIQGTSIDITHQKAADERLAASEERFRVITNSLPVLIGYIDRSHHYRFVNSAYGEWFGADPNILVGQHAREVLGDQAYQVVRPNFDKVIEEAKPVRFETWLDYKDGGGRFVNSQYVPDISDTGEVDGFFVMVQDVTERTRAEQELTESEERFRNLVEQSAQAIIIHCGFRPMFINAAWAHMHGYSIEEALQLPLTEVTIAPHERERMAGYRDARIRGEDAPTMYEYEGRRKDGSPIWIANTVRAVDWKGEAAVQSTGVDITERKLAEKALQESEARFRDFASTAAGWFWEMDAELRISYVSGRVEDVTGASAESYIGKTREEISGENTGDEKWRQHLQDLQDHTPFNDFAFVRTASDGTDHHVSNSGIPIFDDEGAFQGYRGSGRDITEQVQAEQALQKSEARFRDFADTAADWFWEMGPDLRITYISERIEEVYGVPVEWHIGKTREELAGDSVTEEKWQKHLQDLQDHKPFRDFSYARQGPKDRIDHVVIGGDPVFDDGGEFLGYRGSGRDMTAQVHAEEEIVRARDAAREMAEAAEEANRAKSDFLSNMSHEIRTPMNAVLGLAYLLKRENLSPAQEDKVEKIRAAGTHLLGIINDILDFSRIESGELELEDTEFELDSILYHVASVNSLRAAEKDLELLYDVGIDVPRRLQGDSVRLRQMLVNLVDNAIKFTEAGDVIVSVALDRVENGRAWMAFAVKDSGIGMTPEQQDRLFQPFVQADSSTTRRFGGSGLGLAICKEFAELMGGSIDLESTVGEGSTFRITVPLRVVDTPLARPPDLSDLRVLVVDDHETSREVLTSMLRSWSIASVAVPSGEAALQKLAGAEPPFDLVILDWHMPDLDGVDTARAIQSTSARIGPPSKVMILTAYGSENVVSAATDLDIEAVLTKPIQESALLDAITTAFTRAAVHLPDASPKDIRAGLAGIHVLLAEDNEVNQEFAQQLLEDAGMVVTVTADGAEAVATALRPGTRFDVVLMDIQMPELDGIEATELIRERMDAMALPIIAMTAHAMEHERRRCLAAGMNDHLSKPVEPEVLYATLRKWVSAAPGIAAGEPQDNDGTKSSPKIIELPPIPGLDMEVALHRNGNRPDMLQRLLVTFARSFIDLPETIAAELAAGNIDEVRRHAHTMRSAARTIGAESLGLAGDALEKAAEQDGAGPASLSAPTEVFANELRGVLDALAAVDSGQTEVPEAETTGNIDRDQVVLLIERLEPLIDEGNTDARQVLEDLEGSLRGTPLLDTALEVRAYVEDLEDAAAKAALAALAEEVRAIEVK